ncbi:MAG: hypothetical protein HY716_17625 [Planctomycetes bacterium]|nr:hypothetical protein [Planctomycetota bacterium]
MNNVLTIAWATYLQITLRPLYYLTLGVVALLIFCSSFLTQFTFSMEEQMVREMGIASLVLWGFIITVVLSGIIVTQELEDRTAVTLLSKPIRRGAFLLGKYFGLMLSLTAGLVVLAGVLFYTLWSMAKSDLFGDPALALRLFIAAVALLPLGLSLHEWGRRRSRQAEAQTSGRAPRRLEWLGKLLIVAGSVAFLLSLEFARGEPVDGDRGWEALIRAGHSVWEYAGAFMRENGIIVLEGLVLSVLQVGMLAAVCVSLSAFLPVVVSVSATALLYLLGHTMGPMRESIERLDIEPLTAAIRVLGLAIPNLGFLNLQTHFSEGKMISPGYLGLAALHSVTYSAIVFTVSCAFFERREIR